MDYKNTHISTNMQRQKLSIAVFEPARWDTSHEALDRAILYIKRPPKSKRGGEPTMEKKGGASMPLWPAGAYILYILYIYIYIYVWLHMLMYLSQCLCTDISNSKSRDKAQQSVKRPERLTS